MELPALIPISMLNAFEYCPRRFWIEFVQGEMEVNAHVLEGQYRHARAHAEGVQVRQREGEAEVTLRRLYVYSDRLRVAGFADLVEIDREGLVLVEYKKGGLGKWLNDHIQLCAQAICLEERLAANGGKLLPGLDRLQTTIPHGFIFYFGSRRRERVEFDERLRARTVESVEQIWKMLERGEQPRPITKYAKCRDCSLEPICLPREVLALEQRAEGKQEATKGWRPSI